MPSVTAPHVLDQSTAEVVIGVDTHRDSNVLAAVSTGGRLLATGSFPTTAGGISGAIGWAAASGTVTAWAIEGTGSYGAGLTRALLGAGHRVVEITQPNRRVRRTRGGKTGAIDAEAAARSLLADYATAAPKTGNGPVALIRITRTARSSAVEARTACINDSKRCWSPRPLRCATSYAALTTPTLINKCVALRAAGTTVEAGTKKILKSLAQRSRHLTAEARALQQTLAELANPGLTAAFGVGPDTAAALPSVTTPSGSPPNPASPLSAEPARSRPAPGRPTGCGSTAAATDKPTPPCTTSSSSDSPVIPRPRPTWLATSAPTAATKCTSCECSTLRRPTTVSSHQPNRRHPETDPASRLTSIGASRTRHSI